MVRRDSGGFAVRRGPRRSRRLVLLRTLTGLAVVLGRWRWAGGR